MRKDAFMGGLRKQLPDHCVIVEHLFRGGGLPQQLSGGSSVSALIKAMRMNTWDSKAILLASSAAMPRRTWHGR